LPFRCEDHVANLERRVIPIAVNRVLPRPRRRRGDDQNARERARRSGEHDAAGRIELAILAIELGLARRVLVHEPPASPDAQVDPRPAPSIPPELTPPAPHVLGLSSSPRTRGPRCRTRVMRISPGRRRS
jgi:hypothetical protein